jgi:hypothetical protein
MKKIYMTPELEEIEIKSNQPLLLGSGGVTTDGIDTDGYGGVDDGTNIPGAPELPGMPDFGPGNLLGLPF